MKFLIEKILPVLLIILSVFSVSQWSYVPIDNTFLSWAVNFSFLIIALSFVVKYKLQPQAGKLLILLYTAYLSITSIRGLFVPDNYWEWKQLVDGTIILCLPLLIMPFSLPFLVTKLLRYWMKFGIFVFFLLIIWNVSTDAYHFYLGPVLALAIFIPAIRKEWQIIVGILLILMLVADFTARSQVIKAVFAILLAGMFYFSKYLSLRIFKVLFWSFTLTPILILYLSISGVYNPFKELASNKGRYVEKKIEQGEEIEDDLASDTRTFIYEEVIGSAIKHNYIWWGRTAARGNDSMAFGSYNAEDLKTGKYERHRNELNFPNVFTWLGIPGLLLYISFYIQSSYLAIYRSKNIFVKFIGIFIAFHFFYGWIEDTNNFDIANISIWMMIGIAYSEKFREMSNRQFKKFLNLILPKFNII